MIPDEFVNIYKREFRRRGFKKYYRRWYKKYADLTVCFSIKNVKGEGKYRIILGVLLNTKMSSDYPLEYDNGWIIKSALIVPGTEDDPERLYRIDPEKAIIIATDFFSHMTTIEDLIAYAKKNRDDDYKSIIKKIYS